MALIKTNVPIAFSQGLDLKTDSKHVVPGKLLELENGVFSKLGAINKRNGYQKLGTTELDATDITVGVGLSVFKQELNHFTGTEMLSYSQANDKWANKGRVVSLVTQGRRIIQNSNEQSVPSVATNQGVTVYAWEDSSGGIRLSALDQETGNYLISNEEISSTGILPKCLSLNRTVYVFYIEGTTLKYKKVNTSDPTVITSSTDFTTTIDGTYKLYDAIVVGSRIYVTWNNSNASSGISLQFMTSVELKSSEVEYVGEEAQTCITILSDDTNIWIAWHDGSDVYALVYEENLGAEVLAPTSVETVSDIVNITGTIDESTATFWYQQSSAQTYNHLIRKNTLTIGGSVGTASVFLRSVGLASKAFVYNEIVYLAVAHESTLQSTYFLVNDNAEILAKINHQVGGGLTDKAVLSEIVPYSSGVYLFASQVKGKLNSESGILFTRHGINSTTLDFTSNNRFQSATLGDNLHIAGGILHAYDGFTITEHGFHFFPENISTSVNTSGGSVADGNYQYSIVYEWTDNYGQIHRSAPSIATSVTVSGGSGSAEVVLTIPTLRLTRKTGVRVVVYRTENNGTIFYRLNSISSPLSNSTSSDTVSYTDQVADASITSNEILYTTGGVVENISAPSCSLIAEYENRLVLAGLDDENTFLPSKERADGEPVNFSDLFTKRVEAKGGGIGALGVLDGKLILFKKNNAIYFVAGSGPNDLGTDDDMTNPQAIPTDVGCDNPNSVVLTPSGLMFQSNKGIYLLDRSLTVSYIGSPVEDFNELTVTGSSLVPDTNQVRFITSTGRCLVYDYLFDQWSTFTNHEGEDCAIWDNRFVFLKSNGAVYKETPGVFLDDTSAIKLKLTSSWLSMAGVQGFQRVYRLLILGDYKTEHKLIVRIGYDFNEYFTQEVTIDTGSLLENNAYGEDTPYGESEYYGGQYRLYQFRIHLAKQKCQSMRFSIEDFQFDNYGEGFSISGFALEVGAKKGLVKKESGRSFGVA